uniref:Tubulin delta chain n=1 Tax=Trypanosoma congolense (strain IL3000) TaxID=1068625 RepID=G0V1Z8_TRYCI|nr:unnamed protein product [Trypanosoma congolense IL3000]
MACVHVLIGQCGNQLGAHFLNALTEEARRSSDEEFSSQISADHFRRAPPPQRTIRRVSSVTDNTLREEPPLPRSVMVDMEPKVVESVVAIANSGGAFQVRTEQCVTRDEGSGNNWAFGYHEQGKSRRDDIVDSVRRQAEAQGAVRSFHLIHSAAGGTGSGVGCVVSDAIRSEFPRALLLHTAVWPFSVGEVMTQWYNCVLAMSSLRDSADAVFVVYNDDFGFNGGASRRLITGTPGEVSFDSINGEIGRLLLDLYLPKKLCHTSGRALHQQPLFACGNSASSANVVAPLRNAGLADVVEAVALDPALKFFSGLALPSTAQPSPNNKQDTISWHALVRDAAYRAAEYNAPLPNRGDDADGCRGDTLSGHRRPLLWSLRGAHAFSEGFAHLNEVLREGATCEGDRAPLSTPTALFLHEEQLLGRNSHISIYGPSRRIGTRFAMALRRAEELLQANAYVHHFDRYGVGKEEICDAVTRMWDTVGAYGMT